jgi:hypothetical protein
MEIKIIEKSISRPDLQELSRHWYGGLLKGAIDLKNEKIALGGEWHIEALELLVLNGGNKDDIWGFNILVDEPMEKAFEYHSLVNIKPIHNHKSQEIQFPEIREKIYNIVSKKIIW